MQSQWGIDDGNGSGILSGNGTTGGGGGGTGVPVDPYATAAQTREFGTLVQLISEGPIVGPVDGLKSIKLDGTPIQNADGSFNFKGVALALVAGTNTQAAIPGLTDVEAETTVGVQVKVSTGSVTRTISTAGISAIRVRIAVPQLMKIDPTTGARSGCDVNVKIERQSPSWNGGAWEEHKLEGNGFIWGGPFTSEYTKSFRIETPAAGPWSIRVTRNWPDSPDAYTVNDTWWDAYTEITDVKLRRPLTSAAAVRVDSKQFRSVPKFTMEGLGRIIKVPTNYTPATQNPTTKVWTAATYATTGPGTTGGIWDGTFKDAWTGNPAWIWYDMATNPDYGAGATMDPSKIDKWALYSIAQMCDAMVSGEPRFHAALYVQDRTQAIKLLQDMAGIFRGMVFEAGGAITAIQDVSLSPTAIFTNSNVKDGRFTYSGSARKSRHTAALVTWRDPGNGYESSVEYVEDHAAIARYGYNPIQVPGIGITSQAQARRLGTWILLTETMDTETVAFTGALEGSVLRPGEVFTVRDQFRLGTGRLGGRVASATTSVITLDGPATLAPATTYNLSVRLPSGAVETRAVTTAAGVVSAVTVGTPFTAAPDAMAQWALVPVGSETLYRAISIKKGEGLEYEVLGLEHSPDKYAAIDGVTVTPTAARVLSGQPPVGTITLTDSVRIEKDKLIQTLAASWAALPGATGYIAEASQDYGAWRTMIVSGAGAVLEGVTPGAFRVRVCAVYPTGASVFTQATRAVATPTQTAGDAAAASAAAAAAAASAASAQSAANAAQTSANTANTALANIASDSILSPGEKPAVVLDYANITAEQAGIDAQATAYGITTEKTDYDSAVSALTTYLGTLTGWNTIPGSDVAIVGTTFRSKFADVYSTRQVLLNRIYSSAKTLADNAYNRAVIAESNAISSAATDASIKALDAVNKSQLHQVAFSSSALPALPDSTYPAGFLCQTTDNRKWQVNTGGTAWGEITQAAIGIFGQLVVSQLVAANFDNLIPNGNCEATTPAGGWPSGAWEAVALILSTPSQAYSGNNFRQVTGWTYITPEISCKEGEQFYFESMAISNAGTKATIGIRIKDGSGGASYFESPQSTSGSWSKVSVNGLAPAGAVSVAFYIGGTSGTSFSFDNLYARRCADANVIVDGTLQALFARIGKAIQSTNYVAGSAGNAPVGFCLSSVTFTSTLKDGSTISALMELGGLINMNGRRVADVTDRTEPVNRIMNGSFYKSLESWGAGGAYPPVYSASTKTAGTGSAVQSYAGTTYSRAGELTQSFTTPKLFTGQTATLALQTGFSTNRATTDACTVQVYILNQGTGTETLLATYTYANSSMALAWTARTIDVTSYVANGGDFSLRFVLTIADSSVAVKTTSLHIDEVSLSL